MPLETAQMLCTAHREIDGDKYADEVGLYKRAYWNHPCTVWARESKLNYLWLYVHFLSFRYYISLDMGENTQSITKLKEPLRKIPNITKKSMTPPAQAMPDEYKNDDPIKAYRDYCTHEKTLC